MLFRKPRKKNVEIGIQGKNKGGKSRVGYYAKILLSGLTILTPSSVLSERFLAEQSKHKVPVTEHSSSYSSPNQDKKPGGFKVHINKEIPVDSILSNDFYELMKSGDEDKFFNGCVKNLSLSSKKQGADKEDFFIFFNVKGYGRDSIAIHFDVKSVEDKTLFIGNIIAISGKSKNDVYSKILILIENKVLSPRIIPLAELPRTELENAKKTVHDNIKKEIEESALDILKRSLPRTLSSEASSKFYESILLQRLADRDLNTDEWRKWAKEQAGRLRISKGRKIEFKQRQGEFENKQGARYFSYQKRRTV